MLAQHSGCCRAWWGRLFRSGIAALPFNEGQLAPPPLNARTAAVAAREGSLAQFSLVLARARSGRKFQGTTASMAPDKVPAGIIRCWCGDRHLLELHQRPLGRAVGSSPIEDHRLNAMVSFELALPGGSLRSDPAKPGPQPTHREMQSTRALLDIAVCLGLCSELDAKAIAS
jgi:hypothetical protein